MVWALNTLLLNPGQELSREGGGGGGGGGGGNGLPMPNLNIAHPVSLYN